MHTHTRALSVFIAWSVKKNAVIERNRARQGIHVLVLPLSLFYYPKYITNQRNDFFHHHHGNDAFELAFFLGATGAGGRGGPWPPKMH